MNIIVCVKQVLDPEIPAAKFRIDASGKRVIPPEGIPPVINPYDAQAVELALRLKEHHGGKITVLTLSEGGGDKVVKHALSMGADEGVVLSDEAFSGSDSFATAYILARAIEKIGGHDLVLCGRQAADWDEGLVGSLLAHVLDLPLVTLAKSIEVEGGKLKVTRVILNGYQEFSIPLPAVVTVSNEVGQPRLPSGWGIISAARKQIPVWTAADIGADLSRIGPGAALRELEQLFIPSRERSCKLISGENPAEAAARLAIELREAGAI